MDYSVVSRTLGSSAGQSALRPLINWITSTTNATTRRMWMYQATTWNPMNPSSQAKSKTMNSVQSILISPFELEM
jgi:hypothetical protein